MVELVRANQDQIELLRAYLARVHGDYVSAFDVLVERARQQRDE